MNRNVHLVTIKRLNLEGDNKQCTPFGIFNDDTMVGYVMVIYEKNVGSQVRFQMRV